jgi:hypothetical protein
MCQGLLDVRVFSRAYRGNSVLRMLKIRGGDHHSVDILAAKKFGVIPRASHALPSHFFQVRYSLFSTQLPYIAETSKLEIHGGGMLLK